MRHKYGYRKLGKTSSHRLALFKNMSISLIEYEKIKTTLPKAKELRSYFEKLMTKAKKGDFNSHRLIFSKLQNKYATNKLITQLASKYKDRNGGYTRILKIGKRQGDAADIAYIELV